MAAVVSRLITGSEQDVLAGTVAGVAPSTAPFYDAEFRVQQTAGAVLTPRMTLLVGGVAVLEDSWIPGGAETNALEGAPRSDGPSATCSIPAGTRITLNLTQASSAVSSVYVELRESMGGAPASVGKISQLNANAVISEQDVLAGSPIGSLPTTANAWNLAVQIATLTSANAAANVLPTCTLIIGGETIAENFAIPGRSITDWPIEERDTLVSTLAQGGDRVVLNIFSPVPTGTAGDAIAYRVFATPI